jgi:hypothetical protein
MALTSAEVVDVRRFMGYSVTGDVTAAPYRQLLYSNVSYFGLTLDYRLQHLQAEEEAVVRNTYLNPLKALELAIVGSSDNLDTDQAAVWTHNKDEVKDRTKLFNQWRRAMCTFLGFAPGPDLGSGGISVQRC